ncbi:MAG: type I-B CRISPR-associated protein Cas5 [Bacteroidales bacterium]|nr:type I-B CRISPR-associated protein Cas5 [Bacteroidales bacterium]
MNNKIISVDFFADFGMLKKPDTNEPVYLTFNMVHKPALLGIFGAIIGEKGFVKNGVLPDYYKVFENLKLGITPLNHENGNYQKTIIRYNNTTGFASKEEGGNLMVDEQTLIAPAFRCYLLNDNSNEKHQKLAQYLKQVYAEYLPYLGKNEFSLWWENYKEYSFSEFIPQNSFKINSLFIKEESLRDGKVQTYFLPFLNFSVSNGNTFSYFENLPVGYNSDLLQYDYKSFAFTDYDLQEKFKVPAEYLLVKLNTNEIIQLF